MKAFKKKNNKQQQQTNSNEFKQFDQLSDQFRSSSLGTLSKCDDKSILEILKHLDANQLLIASLTSKLFWMLCNEQSGKKLKKFEISWISEHCERIEIFLDM